MNGKAKPGKANNLAGAKADCADANAGGVQPCAVVEVAPTIEIESPKVVVVPRDYVDSIKKYKLEPHRIAVRLGVDSSFDGKGTLSGAAEGDRLRLFTKRRGGKELTLPLTLKAKDFNGGYTVYLQASRASSGVESTILQWGLSEGSKAKKPAVTDKLTCVKLTLVLHKARDPAAPGADPVALAEDKKHDPGRYIHVQADDPWPRGANDPAPALAPADRLPYERALVIVKPVEPASWDGTLVLMPCDLSGKAKGTRLEIFDAEIPAKSQSALAAPLEIPHKPGFADKKLYIQGMGANKNMMNSPLKLAVKDTTDSSGTFAEGDRAMFTVVKMEMDLGKSRDKVAKGASDPPPPMSTEDKHRKGRFVHVQFDQHHGRAALHIKPVQPRGFRGKLELGVWDPATNAKSTAKVELFDDEVPAAGQAAKGNTFEITVDDAFQKNGKIFWAQGKAVSGVLRDAEVRLSLKEHVNVCDAGRLTTVRFKTFEADIPSTSANQVRPVTTGGGSNSPVPRHSLKLANPAPASSDYDHDYTTNEPLVLIEGSIMAAQRINLSVVIEPAVATEFVRWWVNRDRRTAAPKGDHDKIIKLAGNSDDPGLTADAGNRLKATLTANAVGSFHVHPYIDCNDSARFDFDDEKGRRIDREPYLCMNLVLVRVEGVNNLTVKNDAAGSRDIVTAVVGGVVVPRRVNTGDFLATGNDAIHMKATTRVIGGGQDGKRGLDQVFSGWVNNELDSATSPMARGEDVTHSFRAAIPPPPPVVPVPPTKRTRCFWQQNGAEIGGPVLDSGYAGQGTGGNTCTGTAGSNAAIATKTDHASGIGQNWVNENVDSPGGGILRRHPVDATATLRNFKFNIDFRCELVFWTNRNKVDGPADFPACRLYSSALTNTWGIRLESNFDDNFVETRVVRKTIVLTKDANPTRRATPVDGSGLETRQPDGLNHLQADVPFP